MLPDALPYHLKVSSHFKQQSSIWAFFAAARTREEQLAEFRTDLLKNTYQFRRESDPALYERIERVKEKMDLGGLDVIAYQAQSGNDTQLNAGIVYFHPEAHLVFSGPILERLNETELTAVIAHELSHVRFYTLMAGELEIADRIITAVANNHNSPDCYYETARLFKLYMEIFCDRGAYAVLGEAAPVVSSLVKIATGLPGVNVESYEQQAEDIFSAEPGAQSEGPTHPENFIRTRALRLWREDAATADEKIARMIEGRPDLDHLDLFFQRELNDLTKLFLQGYLKPAWFRTTLVTGLARQYFANLQLKEEEEMEDGLSDANKDRLVSVIGAAHPSIREYFSYVLLDFVLADPELEDMPASRALEFASEMQLTATYEPIYRKELEHSKRH